MIVRADGRQVSRFVLRMALMPAGALLVHQLRYMLAYGMHASVVLAQQGHAYLHSLVPWIVLALGVAASGFVRSLGRAMAGQRSLPRYSASFAGLWMACSACLVGIYVTQELLEGFLAAGHPGGLVGVFGYGGWWSIPVALCIGLVVAAICHGARWVLDEVTHRRARSLTPPEGPPAAAARWHEALLPRLSPLAASQSGRGPPR